MNEPGRLAGRLPEWMRSIRFRYTLLYSAVLFGLAAMVIGFLYLVLLMNLRHQPVTASAHGTVCDADHNCVDITVFNAREFERILNAYTLNQLRRYSFSALGVLFVASLGVGWVVAGRVLAPIGRITSVARDMK